MKLETFDSRLGIDFRSILKGNNFIKEWDSADDASKALKIIRSNISKCCRNKAKSAGNVKWKYKDENIFNNKQKTNL